MFPSTQMAAVVIPVGVNLVNFAQDDSAGLKPDVEPSKPNDTLKKSSRMQVILMTLLRWMFVHWNFVA
jgi:hypothetical protein